MTARAIPTRPGLLARIKRGLRRAYLRYRIQEAEQDARIHDCHALLEPLKATAARQYAEALRIELAQL